jgi:hypothetical protein
MTAHLAGFHVFPQDIRILYFDFFSWLTDTTRKMIYCNTLDPLLISADNSSRYQYWWAYQPIPIIDY